MNKIRHSVLSNYITLFAIHLILDQWFKQTLCVRYFYELVLVSSGNIPVNKRRHYVLDYFLCLFRDHYVTNRWIISETMC